MAAFAGSLGCPVLEISSARVESRHCLARVSSRRVANCSRTVTMCDVVDLPPGLYQRLESQISSDKVVLFMKGVPRAPQCGFSRRAVSILTKFNASFRAYDVLVDDNIRQGMKVFSSWPTFPQLYIGGEFIGGVDIMESLASSGELLRLLIDADAI
mmetsp:Transcript_6563/g.13231  ORF Transcript_6563/g.13231 Transcript_6563/m.13231 type:complete len:156 (-) Transcript_6563:973-1440(-)